MFSPNFRKGSSLKNTLILPKDNTRASLSDIFGEFGTMTWIDIIPAKVLKRIRFLAIALLASSLVLLPGSVWYKATLSAMSESTARSNSTLLNMQMIVLRQKMVTALSVSTANFWTRVSATEKELLRRDLPFDLVVMYGSKREFLDGFRTMSETKSNVTLTTEAAHNIVPTASSFFDHVSEQNVSAGIHLIDGHPIMLAMKSLALRGQPSVNGYALVGRWLNADALASSQEQAESRFQIFTLMDEDGMPQDVRESVAIAQRNNGFTYDVDRSGSGFVYTLLDDISDRPALMVKSAWTLPQKANGDFGFGVFYVVSALVGFGVWGTLTRNDVSSRRRVRRFDGLSSLTTEHIATLVQAFPGYAFAVTSELQYIGVSHILAGVAGQEPSYFSGKRFGSLECERDDGTLLKVFTHLRDLNRWPRVGNFNHVVESLGQRHEFSGMAHYLTKQDLILVILSQQQLSQQQSTHADSSKSTFTVSGNLAS